MTNTGPARPDHESGPLTRWVHTGIEAPYLLDVQGFATLDSGRGTAFSAEMIHPEHGVVGRISHRGFGDPTTFLSNNHTTFSNRDLAEFVAQCRQDGVPLDPRKFGVDHLLKQVINEGGYADAVKEMRQNGDFLVRSVEPRTQDNHGAERGEPLVYTEPVLRRAAREAIVAKLAQEPENRLADGAHWQMFNGQDWVPLLPEPTFTAEQKDARIAALVALHQETTSPNGCMMAQQIDNGLYAYGMRLNGRFTLIGDAYDHIATTQWCQHTRRVSPPVRFERWSTRDGLLESGAVHGAKSCRALVTID